MVGVYRFAFYVRNDIFIFFIFSLYFLYIFYSICLIEFEKYLERNVIVFQINVPKKYLQNARLRKTLPDNYVFYAPLRTIKILSQILHVVGLFVCNLVSFISNHTRFLFIIFRYFCVCVCVGVYVVLYLENRTAGLI
jgi:hypothetical protein